MVPLLGSSHQIRAPRTSLSSWLSVRLVSKFRVNRGGEEGGAYGREGYACMSAAMAPAS